MTDYHNRTADQTETALSGEVFGLEWLATALKNRSIDVSGASSSAVAAIVALDHYRGEREGSPLANVAALSPLTNEPVGVTLSIEDASRLRDLCIAITKFKEGDIFFTRPDFPDLIARLTTAITISGAQ